MPIGLRLLLLIAAAGPIIEYVGLLWDQTLSAPYESPVAGVPYPATPSWWLEGAVKQPPRGTYAYTHGAHRPRLTPDLEANRATLR
jgi:hypothetical protein